MSTDYARIITVTMNNEPSVSSYSSLNLSGFFFSFRGLFLQVGRLPGDVLDCSILPSCNNRSLYLARDEGSFNISLAVILLGDIQRYVR
jgi:hypothetical protein